MRRSLGLASARRPSARWAGAAREVAVFAAAYLCYRAIAALVAGDAGAAFAHARAVIALERSLHVFVEPAVQAWASRSEPLIDAAGWLYVNAQLTVMAGALLYVYVRHRGAYSRLRDALLAAMAIALPCYALFPTAPPRLLPAFGFADSVAHATGLALSPTTAWLARLANPYAAIPSLHIAFALILARSLAPLARSRAASAAWHAYPLLIAFVVIATANHFLLDVLLGALAALAALAASRAAHRFAGWRTRGVVAAAPSGATG